MGFTKNGPKTLNLPGKIIPQDMPIKHPDLGGDNVHHPRGQTSPLLPSLLPLECIAQQTHPGHHIKEPKQNSTIVLPDDILKHILIIGKK
jgi:hypothetical protein